MPAASDIFSDDRVGNVQAAAPWHAGSVSETTDWDAYRAALDAKLAPERIRSTLAFAGLFQLTNELLKSSILDDVKGFFGYSKLIDGGRWLLGPSGEVDYKNSVLSLVPGKPFDSSLAWLQQMGAITEDQAGRLDEIYAHRHDLTHELAKYLVDPAAEPEVNLLVDALTILKAVSRFWVQVELDVGTFEGHPDVTVEDVTPLSLMTLQTCIDAYVAGLPS